MKLINYNKCASADEHGVTLYYADSLKHFTYKYQNPRSSSYRKNESSTAEEKASGFPNSHYRKFKYQERNFRRLSPYQIRVINDAVYGLQGYNRCQLHTMSRKEKQEVIQLHLTATKVLNSWKQEIVSGLVDDFFANWLPEKNGIRRAFQNTKGITDTDLFEQFDFVELNVSYSDIANKLIEKLVLPQDFMDTYRIAA